MNISLFTTCFDLFLAANPSCEAKLILVSDINHDDLVTSSAFESQCEWRDENGEPIARPTVCTWEAISAYETEAQSVPVYSN